MSLGQRPPDHHVRMERARLALDGLSVGDAFGQHFFVPNVELLIGQRVIPFPRWQYTDDTEMALALVAVLDRHGQVDQDSLADLLAERYRRNPYRGYGAMAHTILQALAEGRPWRTVAPAVFDGQGSLGNGAAMRVAPLGAYFADDLDRVAAEADVSAGVTHTHPEGRAGAIAVAVAAAWAWRVGTGLERAAPGCLVETALRYTPPGETRAGLEQARRLPWDASPITAARLLGSGLRVTAADTVPFTLWCADRHRDDYAAALWNTVAGLGDRDTTCAIVGGIVAMAAGRPAIPADWLRAREPLG